MSKRHEIKIWPPFFVAVSKGEKTFEIRKNDRDYKPGDVIFMREFSPKDNRYTGRLLSAEIGFVYSGKDFGVKEGYCVFSLLGVKRERDDLSNVQQPTL